MVFREQRIALPQLLAHGAGALVQPFVVEGCGDCLGQACGIQGAAADRRRAQAEGADALGPVELVKQVGHDDLGDPGARSPRRRSCAAVVDHCGDAREELRVGDRIDRQHVFWESALAELCPSPGQDRTAFAALDRVEKDPGCLGRRRVRHAPEPDVDGRGSRLEEELEFFREGTFVVGLDRARRVRRNAGIRRAGSETRVGGQEHRAGSEENRERVASRGQPEFTPLPVHRCRCHSQKEPRSAPCQRNCPRRDACGGEQCGRIFP